MPRITVCIPTYNYGRFVGAAIASVLDQSLQDFEILVSDNASTDETADVVAQWAGRDGRVRYRRNDHNLGMVANWNCCLAAAGGEYVKFLCADDLLEPGALELLSGLLDRHPGVVLASGARLLVTEDGGPGRVLAYSGREQLLPGSRVIRRCIARGNRVGEPSAVIFRRVALAGGFDERYPQVADFQMWLRLLECGDFAFTPQVVCRFRQHAEQETKKNLKARQGFADELRLCRAYAGKVPATALWEGLARRYLALWLHLLRTGCKV